MDELAGKRELEQEHLIRGDVAPVERASKQGRATRKTEHRPKQIATAANLVDEPPGATANMPEYTMPRSAGCVETPSVAVDLDEHGERQRCRRGRCPAQPDRARGSLRRSCRRVRST